MNPLNEIRHSIENMSYRIVKRGGAGIFTAKVLSTDGDTCRVDIDGLVVSDVRLRAVVNGEESGVLITPKTGSYVTVADLLGDLTQLTVVGFSEVKKIAIDANSGIEINGNEYGGLVKIEDLVGTLQHMVEIFNSHTHTVPNGTSATPAVPMDPVQRDGMENKKIKHGGR